MKLHVLDALPSKVSSNLEDNESDAAQFRATNGVRRPIARRSAAP